MLFAVLLLATTACAGSGDNDASDASTTTASSTTVPTPSTLSPAPTVPGAGDRVELRGYLTLDGAPVDAQFLGAVVRKDGLVTPCQGELPPVAGGTYDITVLGDAESRGCGVPGAEILLWIFARDTFFYSSGGIAWPGNGALADFDATFATATPNGDVPPTTQFNGRLLARDGTALPSGSRVEAYVGTTRCGIASTRHSGDFEGYVLAVVGPEEIPACESGATLTFRVNGEPAVETSVNTPIERQEAFDLTIK
jgi:hypothetical protein